MVSLDQSVSAFGGFGSDVGMTLEEQIIFTAAEATKLQFNESKIPNNCVM